MNIQIITSSYPAFAGDPGGTAGLFVEAFARELHQRGHTVIVQPVERKTAYTPAPGIIIEPIPWDGGDQALSTMKIYDPRNWPVFWNFFKRGRVNTAAVHKKYAIDYTLCMWVIPSGLFGYWMSVDLGIKYDVWALGSDIWKIRHIPLAGERLIKKVVNNASRVYADGQQLCDDVSHITDSDCKFLSSSRVLPAASAAPLPTDTQKIKLLFVGRYHTNKGPDLLLDALLFLEEDVRAKIHVDIFGLGNLERELHTACRENGLQKFVTVHGPINAQDLANRLRQAEYLLIPSRIESVPVIFSDALQTGTPVVATPVGDLPYFINKFKCGVLAEKPTPLAYAAAIKTALRNKKEDYSLQVSAAYEHFSVSHSVDVWLAGIQHN